MNLIGLFTKNLDTRQKQYEAVRAVAFNEEPFDVIAARFGYSSQALRNLVNNVKKGKHSLFPSVKPGPKERHTPAAAIDEICKLRREKSLSSRDIAGELNKRGVKISVKTVERALADKGFGKLQRRTNKEKHLSKQGTIIPSRTSHLDFKRLEPFRAECQVAGIFLFLPYILETGILDIVSQCALPESSDIGNRQAALSMLALKLLGKDRLSHINQYNSDSGLGAFAGLNHLPQPTYMCTYSCRTSAASLMDFQKTLLRKLTSLRPDLYQGETINLDFHSIPHFGDESQMEKVWCGARGKALKGANTFIAQDGGSNSIIYSSADIKRSEASSEIKNFVDYWIDIKGIINETLVFDSMLTDYRTLYDLDDDNIKFITLRRRSKKLIDEALAIPDSQWENVHLPIPKRKYKDVKVHHSNVSVIKGKETFRQLIVRDHGRIEPTFVISNNVDFSLQDILMVYAQRWHIENKLAELVKFFSLNSLSSPIMTRIHFDVLWTIIADTLYHIFARELRRFETMSAPKMFRNFIDMPGIVQFDGKNFIIKIRKRASTPVLLGVKKLNQDIPVPWLDNRLVKIQWTA
jgi:transposase